MFYIVNSPEMRKNVHFGVFLGVIPLWVLLTTIFEFWLKGASTLFSQSSTLVVGAVFVFCMDFVTAITYRVIIRGEESFDTRGMATGAKKLGLWIVVGAGSTIWANTFPNDPEQVTWTNPVWVGANIDLLAFLYMYAMDIISSVENVTGRKIGQTGIGQFFKALSGHILPTLSDAYEQAPESS